MTSSELDTWFAAHILPCEAALTRYLHRAWPNASDVPDIRQDVYVRVYESAARHPPNQPRAFLFATARNLIADRLRRGRIVSIDYTEDFESSNVLVDELTPEQRLSARQELRRLIDAFNRLPDRCRDVVWFMRIEGLSQKEAAARLGIPEGTLESNLHRTVKALARAVFGNDNTSDAKEPAEGTIDETEHG